MHLPLEALFEASYFYDQILARFFLLFTIDGALRHKGRSAQRKSIKKIKHTFKLFFKCYQLEILSRTAQTTAWPRAASTLPSAVGYLTFRLEIESGITFFGERKFLICSSRLGAVLFTPPQVEQFTCQKLINSYLKQPMLQDSSITRGLNLE